MLTLSICRYGRDLKLRLTNILLGVLSLLITALDSCQPRMSLLAFRKFMMRLSKTNLKMQDGLMFSNIAARLSSLIRASLQTMETKGHMLSGTLTSIKDHVLLSLILKMGKR
jgi:hypothetical protein